MTINKNCHILTYNMLSILNLMLQQVRIYLEFNLYSNYSHDDDFDDVPKAKSGKRKSGRKSVLKPKRKSRKSKSK